MHLWSTECCQHTSLCDFSQLAYKVERTRISVITSTSCLISESAWYFYWFLPSIWKCPRSPLWGTLLPQGRLNFLSTPHPRPYICLVYLLYCTLLPGPLTVSSAAFKVPQHIVTWDMDFPNFSHSWMLALSWKGTEKQNRKSGWEAGSSQSESEVFLYSVPQSLSHADVRCCSAVQVIAVSLLLR